MMTDPNTALFLELENMIANAAVYSHPCDTEDIKNAGGKLLVQDVYELLERHRANFPVTFYAMPDKHGMLLQGTTLCQRHYEEAGRKNYAEQWAEGQDKNGNMMWFTVNAALMPVCVDCHDNYDEL